MEMYIMRLCEICEGKGTKEPGTMSMSYGKYALCQPCVDKAIKFYMDNKKWTDYSNTT